MHNEDNDHNLIQVIGSLLTLPVDQISELEEA